MNQQDGPPVVAATDSLKETAESTASAPGASATEVVAPLPVSALTPPPAVTVTVLPDLPRAAWIDSISAAYGRGQKVQIVTGPADLTWCREQKAFMDPEQTIFQEFREKFTFLIYDIANGISLLDPEPTALTSLSRACAQANKEEFQGGALAEMLSKSGGRNPLKDLELLAKILSAVTDARRTDPKSVKKVCVIFHLAGSLFPRGEFDRLPSDDKLVLVSFLRMIQSTWFKQRSSHLILLMSDFMSELNERLVKQPGVDWIEMDPPNRAELHKFVSGYTVATPDAEPVAFEKGLEGFLDDAAGLPLYTVQEMLEGARSTSRPLTRKGVLVEVEKMYYAEFQDKVTFCKPIHTSADLCGYQAHARVFQKMFKDCENPATAIAAFLVTGPNGSGKTYQIEAYAGESGRVVLTLSNIRGMYFGETDMFFEKLRRRCKAYGKVCILYDEADAQMGSVTDKNTHETEKRLTMKIAMMITDKSMLGGVVWGFGTSRPNLLPPDIIRRCAIKIPILDLQGAEREEYIRALFDRKGVKMEDAGWSELFEQTKHLSASNLNDLINEVRRSGLPVLEVLKDWQTGEDDIVDKRRLQSLRAAQHCSYKSLLTEEMRNLIGTPAIRKEIDRLRVAVGE